MRARIAIRVDASLTIGLGHVKRCLSLAHALREQGAAVRFVVRSLGVDVAAAIANDGFDCATLPQPRGVVPVDDVVPHASWACVPWQVDAAQAVSVLREERPDWVIVDHYAFGARWHSAVASGLACRIAAIDDMADRDMAVDLLIDHNQVEDHRLKYAGRLAPQSTLLGGPRFALLGPSYATAVRYTFHEHVRSIGIFMGGADTGNFSLLALRACRAAHFYGLIEIVTTRSNANLVTLRSAAAEDGNALLTADLAELSAFFARHDLQVGAGGGATWERCCIGAPTLAIIAADNQRQVLLPLARGKAVRAIESQPPTGDEVACGVGLLKENIELRRQLSLHAMTLVDGLGASRTAKQLLDA